MYRAEKIVLTEGIHTRVFALADRNARLAKGLYNAALFRLRQSFTGWDQAIASAERTAWGWRFIL